MIWPKSDIHIWIYSRIYVSAPILANVRHASAISTCPLQDLETVNRQQLIARQLIAQLIAMSVDRLCNYLSRTINCEQFVSIDTGHANAPHKIQ